MDERKPQLSDLLPGRVQVGEEPGTPRRRFTVVGVIVAAVAAGVVHFMQLYEFSDLGFKIAMAVAGVVAFAIVAPSHFMTEERKSAAPESKERREDAG